MAYTFTFEDFTMATSPDKVELRVDVPAELMQRLDAVMQAKGMTARHQWVVPVLEEAIAREVHAATLLLRMCRINPLLGGKAAE
jgi:hypothetical protein